MRVGITVVLLFATSCGNELGRSTDRTALSRAQADSGVPEEMPRETALKIAGEIVAAQRLARAKPENSSNEPDLIVRQVFRMPKHPELAIAVCRYRGLPQGYAVIVRHDRFEGFKELAAIGGGHYRDVDQIRVSVQARSVVLVDVSSITGRGNPAGHEKLLILPDKSIRWSKRSAD